MDLSNLSAEEIAGLLLAGEKELNRRKKEQRSEAIKAVHKTAESYGYTIAELFGGEVEAAPVEKKTRKPVEIKYRDPDAPENTWTGRGITPKWLQQKLEQGLDIALFTL